MKKILTVILALAVFFSLASCGSAADALPQTAPAPAEAPNEAAPVIQEAAPPVQEAVTPVQEPAPPVQEAAPVIQETATVMQEAVPQVQEPAPAEAKTSDEISVEGSGYQIEFLSAKRDKDYAGNEIVLIKYRFTNKSGATAAFWQVFNDSVSQNGRAMSSEGIVLDYSVMASTYESLEKGQTAVCCFAYPLYSATDPIDLTMMIYNYNTASAIASASGRVYIEE